MQMAEAAPAPTVAAPTPAASAAPPAGPSAAGGGPPPPGQVSVPQYTPAEIKWPIVVLYVVTVAFLGVALLYSLSLGKDYLTFAGSVITALTTIAGFAVGANATHPST
jgi:hypothetical protein